MAGHLSVAERIAIGFACAIFTAIVFFIVPSLHKYIMYEWESSVREIQPAAVRLKGVMLQDKRLMLARFLAMCSFCFQI